MSYFTEAGAVYCKVKDIINKVCVCITASTSCTAHIHVQVHVPSSLSLSIILQTKQNEAMMKIGITKSSES